jgi:hypothetical protein
MYSSTHPSIHPFSQWVHSFIIHSSINSNIKSIHSFFHQFKQQVQSFIHPSIHSDTESIHLFVHPSIQPLTHWVHSFTHPLILTACVILKCCQLTRAKPAVYKTTQALSFLVVSHFKSSQFACVGLYSISNYCKTLMWTVILPYLPYWFIDKIGHIGAAITLHLRSNVGYINQ